MFSLNNHTEISWNKFFLILVLGLFCLTYIRKCSNNSNYERELKLAITYTESREDQKAFPIYQELAAKDVLLAQWWLGISYLYGKGTAKDEDQAMYWLEKSARKGFIDSMLTLASTAPPNKDGCKRTLYWLNNAIDHDNTEAMFRLWSIQTKGLCDSNILDADKWLIKAAKYNDEFGILSKGMTYFEGIEKNINYPEATSIFQKTVDKYDNAIAHYYLYQIFHFGLGCKTNNSIAIQHLKTAADNGLIIACSTLAAEYYYGSSYLSKNPHMAYKYASRSANKSRESAEIIELLEENGFHGAP